MVTVLVLGTQLLFSIRKCTQNHASKKPAGSFSEPKVLMDGWQKRRTILPPTEAPSNDRWKLISTWHMICFCTAMGKLKDGLVIASSDRCARARETKNKLRDATACVTCDAGWFDIGSSRLDRETIEIEGFSIAAVKKQTWLVGNISRTKGGILEHVKVFVLFYEYYRNKEGIARWCQKAEAIFGSF